MMNVKERERTAILRSLAAGVVPGIGLHLIQVGRKEELEALLSDLGCIENGASTIRFVIGRFGSGKSFFLNLIRTVALEKKFVVLQGDITVDRRLHGTGGQARALYTELIKNMSTRAKPEGGAMPGLVERFITDVLDEAGGDATHEELETAVKKRLSPLLELTHGMNFVRILSRYAEGFAKHNEDLMNSAMRWLRAEYGTKTEVRQDLNVRDIIEDSQIYDLIKLWAYFVRIAGYRGLFVNVDEMVVLSERLNHKLAREKNYEAILQILNDCLQGNVQGLGFCFAGTEEFLTDRRHGLFSYEALATRLAENPFLKPGMVDKTSPVIRLQSLTREELFVLLDRITEVHASGKEEHKLFNHNDLAAFIGYCEQRLGANYFMTPRDAVQKFIGLLSVKEQKPNTPIGELLDQQGTDAPVVKLEEMSRQTNQDSGSEQLTRFAL